MTDDASTVFRASCEDCNWSYEKERRAWVQSAAENHEQVYRTAKGHETEIVEVRPMTEDASGELCDRCEKRQADPDIATHAEYNLCQQCVREIMRESAKEGERGKGQRPIGEQHAVDRRR